MILPSVNVLKAWDEYTILNEPISSSDLMERAATLCAQKILKKYKDHDQFHIFCGPGNNGGDGLVIARWLINNHKKIELYFTQNNHSYSSDFSINLERIKRITNEYQIHYIETLDQLPVLHPQAIIIDAIFGYGLNKPIIGDWERIIEQLNTYENTTIAIDMPSGLPAHEKPNGIVVNANHTYTFQVPKLSLLMPSNYQFVGEWECIDIELSDKFFDKKIDAATINYIVPEELAQLIIPATKYDHKGTRGHSLMIAGAAGKSGAATLCAKACIKAGAGLVTCFIPESILNILQVTIPEVMCKVYEPKNIENELSKIELHPYKAIGIGPGIGIGDEAKSILSKILDLQPPKLVIDADAINIIAQNNWQNKLPENSLLTPHPKELERLMGQWSDDYEKLKMLDRFARQYKCYVLLKGAHSILATPSGNFYFNSSGTPAMAIAGSGDVLTGIITALLSIGHQPQAAAILGMYLHGQAGEAAASANKNITAQDIITYYTYTINTKND